MTDEIIKLYENAGIEKNCYPKMLKCHHCEHYKVIGEYTGGCSNEVYPPFTAEKQLELIKWLSTKELKIRTNKQPYAVYIGVLGDDNTCFYGCEGLSFQKTLSELINNLWQSLTDTEKEQIREILK